MAKISAKHSYHSELIKLRRILITTITVVDDVVEYNERGLEMMFTLNPDYIPVEGAESEFDLMPEGETNEKDNEK